MNSENIKKKSINPSISQAFHLFVSHPYFNATYTYIHTRSHAICIYCLHLRFSYERNMKFTKLTEVLTPKIQTCLRYGSHVKTKLPFSCCLLMCLAICKTPPFRFCLPILFLYIWSTFLSLFNTHTHSLINVTLPAQALVVPW